ncbi:competence protein CoiA family protein [Nocardia noduli]|uniref:competence protein CoiA family protein n=1 Tax=Nocardia noduli TaxID=2815722 RepID=UPI001C24A644|nr:hypothetical protein [Nocardia noduli]
MAVKQARLCPGKRMTKALGPYDEVVDVRDQSSYTQWRSQRGLRCMLCGNAVEAWTSSAANQFARHGKNTPAGRLPPEGRGSETLQHAVLKYWTRDHLRSIGFDAEVEPQIGEQYPDVYGTRHGTSHAVEIQWSSLDHAAAAARTAGLRAAGCDQVLWLTRHCDWVERLPAAGLGTFTPAAVGGYHLHTGHLAMKSTRTPGHRTLQVQPSSLPRLLTRWADQQLVWAYTTTNTAGWATVTDWEEHTRNQATQIVTLQQRLDKQVTHIEDSRRRLAATADQLTQTTDTLTQERARHTQTRDNLAADLARARTEHNAHTEEHRQQLGKLTAGYQREVTALTAELEHAKQRITTLTRAVAVLGGIGLLLIVLLWLT